MVVVVFAQHSGKEKTNKERCKGDEHRPLVPLVARKIEQLLGLVFTV